MDLQRIVMLVLQGSILLTVFGFGLHATGADMLYFVKQPKRLLLSLLSMFVIMPVLAVALAFTFNFKPPVEIALVALALSPVPPLLPNRETRAGGHTGHALALLATAALLSLVVIPVALRILRQFVAQPLNMTFGAVALLALKTVLLPLLAGIVVHRLAPGLARRIDKPIALIAKLLLAAGALAILVSSLPAIATLIGNGTLLVFVLFVLIGILVGHVLGGPRQEDKIVLALSTASRHPAIAAAIGMANYPQEKLVPAAVLLYLVISVLVALPYMVWQRKRQARETASRPHTDDPAKQQRRAA